MEKSIETIWKEGFLKSDALVAPRLNDLYNQKSNHIIDKFERMFKINLIAIVVGSLLFLVASFFLGIPITGVGFFLILSVIVVVNKKLSNGLEKIDKNQSSYQYLKAFDAWIKEQLIVNRKMAKFYYPLFFLSMVMGFWFSGKAQGVFNEVIGSSHEIYFVNGIPIFWMLLVVFITCLLAIFGDRIYNSDVNVIYGRVFKKLEKLISDIESI